MLDLETVGGPDWAGWMLHDGKIYAPEWRQGLHPGEIRAIPYLHASIREHRRQAETARQAAQEFEALCEAAERQARYYRDLVRLESRHGLMLCRITG